MNKAVSLIHGFKVVAIISRFFVAIKCMITRYGSLNLLIQSKAKKKKKSDALLVQKELNNLRGEILTSL